MQPSVVEFLFGTLKRSRPYRQRLFCIEHRGMPGNQMAYAKRPFPQVSAATEIMLPGARACAGIDRTQCDDPLRQPDGILGGVEPYIFIAGGAVDPIVDYPSKRAAHCGRKIANDGRTSQGQILRNSRHPANFLLKPSGRIDGARDPQRQAFAKPVNPVVGSRTDRRQRESSQFGPTEFEYLSNVALAKYALAGKQTSFQYLIPRRLILVLLQRNGNQKLPLFLERPHNTTSSIGDISRKVKVMS